MSGPVAASRGVRRETRRVLGLDVGSKTIGVAVTDELGVAAHGVTTLQRRGTAKDVLQVAELAARYDTKVLVVGLPLDEYGEIGHRAERVQVLCVALREAGFTVDEWDERYTTRQAEATLLAADVSRKRRKEVIDQMAAQVILQSWLDAQSTSSSS